MRLTINRDTNALIRALNFPETIVGPAGSNSFGTKRGDTPAHEIVFGVPFGSPEEIDLAAPTTSLKYGLKLPGDFAGDYIVSNWNGSAWAYQKTGASSVVDAVLTEAETTITTATAAFTAADIGLAITGSGIPAAATIASVTSATEAALSAAATASATGVTITIAGRTPAYTVAPSYNTAALNAALVDGTIAQTVADSAARLALTEINVGDIIMQSDTGIAWQLIDAEKIATADGWDTAPQKEYIDLAGEIEIRQGDAITSTLTFTERVYNDVNKGTEGTPAELPDLKATQAEAEAGTDNEKWMTPLSTAQAIAAARPSIVLISEDDSLWQISITAEGQLQRTKL